METKPSLIIVAGSNGSGKSTLTRRTFQRSNLPVIDPDAIARQINPYSPESVSIAAGRQAINLTRNYLDNGQSFIAETTLSGNNYLRIMDKAKEKGFEISLIYIGINNIDTSINRVELRVQRGGHNVPPLDIRRRYERSQQIIKLQQFHLIFERNILSFFNLITEFYKKSRGQST